MNIIAKLFLGTALLAGAVTERLPRLNQGTRP